MAFITKEAIINHFNRCADMLDTFDAPQIEAIYDFIAIINSTGNSYKMMKTPDRVAVFQYLSQLKNNSNGADEHTVFNRFRDIHTAMAAMGLLSLKYKEMINK